MDRDTLQLLAGFAHDLRTPISAIAGHSTLMALGVHGPLTEAQSVALRRIENNQQHLISLIGEFLSFAETLSGSTTRALEACAMRAMVQHAVDAVGSAAQQAGVRVRWGEGRADGNVYGDSDAAVAGGNVCGDSDAAPGESDTDLAWANESAIGAVLTILLEDAIAGSAREQEVHVRLHGSTTMVHVVVESNGRVITADTADLVFVPYARDASGRQLYAANRALALPRASALAQAVGAEVRAVPDDVRRVLRLDVPRAANLGPLAG